MILKKAKLVKVVRDDDRYILLSNLTADIMVVDENVYDLWNTFKDGRDGDEVTGNERRAVETLYKKGFLIPVNTDELGFIRSKIEHCKTCSKVGYAFFVTMKCNFKCVYCYQYKDPISMSWSVAKACVDYILSQASQKDQKEIVITYTGGDPIVNFPLMKKIILALKHPSVNFPVNLVTNGSLLSRDYCKFLGDHDWRGVQITLDGPKTVHDSLRPFYNGKGSFDAVITGLENALDYCKAVTLHINVDVTNISHAKETLEYLETKGFRRDNLFISFMPTIAPLQESKKRGDLKPLCTFPASYLRDINHR